MKIIDLPEQKRIELEMLLYVDGICRENNIKYSLCAGTLLGAVRHKGFIPWDDDIDIFLIRSEYTRLLKILAKKNDYLLITPSEDNYYLSFAKLIDKRTAIKRKNPYELPIKDFGVFIDIFPIDGLPDDEKSRLKFVSETRDIMFNMLLSTNKYAYARNRFRSLIKLILKYPKHKKALNQRTKDEWKNILLRTMQTYKFENSKYAGFILSAYGIKEVLPSKVFKEFVEIEFEGYKFPVIKEYKQYLKSLYGDYMKLPPKRKRISLHHYIPYWKE